MVQLTAIIIFFLSAHVVHASASGTATHPQDPPEVPQQLQHNISKRFIKFPILLPAILPTKSVTFAKRYTNLYSPVLYSPVLYRYKRFVPSIQASPQAVISTNPPTESLSSLPAASITFLDGSHLWDKLSAILALLQSLKQAILNIYQSTNLQAFLEWNQKALNLLARINAFGVKFVPVPPVQNSTVLFNLGAVVPLKKYLVPNINITGSVGNILGVNTNGGRAPQMVPGPIRPKINIVPPSDLLSIYTRQVAPPSISIPLAVTQESVASGTRTPNADKSGANVKVDDGPSGDNNVDSGRVFSAAETSKNEVDGSPLSNNLLGDLKNSDRRKKRSIGFGRGTFVRAQANFRRIFPNFEGFSSNWHGPVYKPAYRRIPQHDRWTPQHQGPQWEFPKNLVKGEQPVNNEIFATTTKKSDVEVEEFNFLPHFESHSVFDIEIERVNDKMVAYPQSISSVPFSIEGGPFKSDNVASEPHKVSYAKPEVAHEYVEDGYVNGGDFRALPNFQRQREFNENEDFSIDPDQPAETNAGLPVRHTFVEAPKPIQQTRPFVVQPRPFAGQKSFVSQITSPSPLDEPRPFVEAKPLEQSRLFVDGERETFGPSADDVKSTSMPFLIAPTDRATEIQDTNEDPAKSLHEVFKIAEVSDSRMVRLKNRFRKLPRLKLNDRFTVAEERNDLVRRPMSDFVLDDESVHVVTDAKANFDQRKFALTSEVVLDDDKKKIGRRVIYKRIKTEQDKE